uniref:Neurotransmitter-gated ion-channel transmembrane domain-containing protein n=1 Tax=Acrobeloides nanus TaxID=290746 RepID=A0A914DX21_9BILA
MNVTWFNFQPIRYNPEINLPEFQISAIDNQYCNGEFMYVITDSSYRLACMLFIFGSLLEFAIVNSLMRRSAKFDLMAQRFRCKCKRRDHVFPGTVYENDDSREDDYSIPTVFKPRPKKAFLERVRSLTSKQRHGDPPVNKFLDNNGIKAPPRIEAPYHTTDKCTIFALKASYFSRKGLLVDKTSRILFPVLFLLFNFFYWWFYILRETTDPNLEQEIQ